MKTIFTLGTILACFLAAAFAQTDTGIPSYEATIPINAYESVNLGNLNILLQAPVRSKGGPLPLSFMLTANSQIYVNANKVYLTTASATSSFWANGAVLAQGYWNGGALISNQVTTCIGGGQNNHTTQYTLYGLYDGIGTLHPVFATWFGNPICNTPLDVFTSDGSGLEVAINTLGGPTVYDRFGNISSFAFNLTPSAGVITDTHGNHLTVGLNSNVITYSDQLTSTAALSYPTAQPSGTSTSYQYTDGTGALRSVTANFLGGTSGTTFNPAYSCPGLINGSAPIYPLSSVNFPDSSSLFVTWELASTGYLDGRLATVKIPTGATYTHTYSGGTNGDGLWCAATSVSNATMSIGNGTGTWKFARVVTTSGCPTVPPTTVCSTTTVTKPDNSGVVYTFINNIMTSKVVKDTDGATVLNTMVYCYNSTISNCNSSVPILPGSVAAYHYVPGVANPAETVTNSDSHGNLTEVDRYDFGPTLVSKELITYGSWNGSSCQSMASAHIVGLPCDVQTQDSSSNVLSHSRFNYNVSTGDLLNKYDYSGASTFLTTTFTYNSNGTVASMTRPDGVQGTVSNTQCNGYLPNSATSSVGTASMTWDCNGGVPATTTDLNGLVMTTTYGDPLYRVTQISNNGGRAPVTFTYTSPTRFSRDAIFNSNNSISNATTTLNSLGQTISLQNRQSPSSTNYDTISFTYDSSGHETGTSTPCTTTIGAICPTPAVAYTYDGANRPLTVTTKTSTNGVLTYSHPHGDVSIVLSPAPTGENNKTVQIESDGLGRTTSVCTVVTSGLSGTGGCGQRTTASGYLTKYTLDALGRPTQISRNAQATPVNTTATYDMLSRTTQATTPESNQANFYFDTTQSSCLSAGFLGLAGHVNMSVDNSGNTLCYAYEGMGRLSALLPVSGPALSTSPEVKYVYASGLGNNLGKLTDISTSLPPYTTTNTDTQFAYNTYGDLSDLWQNSPGLGGSSNVDAQTFSDNFNRSNGPLGSNWSSLSPFTEPTIVSNTAQGFSVAYWIGSGGPNNPNEYAQANLTWGSDTTDALGFSFRQGTGGSLVGIYFQKTGGNIGEDVYDTTGTLDSALSNSTVFSGLTFNNGDLIKVEFLNITSGGNPAFQINIYQNGTLFKSWIDNQAPAVYPNLVTSTLSPGLYSPGGTTFSWDNFAGGTSALGNFFHTTTAYFDNGVLQMLGGLPGQTNISYGVDGEGRPYSAAQGTTNIVTSVTYDSASNPLTVTFGNSDTDTYQWDAASQNMKQYQFKIGTAGTTDTGVLTWNPNGTLQTWAITDNLSGSSDTQTCNTAHDDLVRITSFNCGSVWNESYSYSPDYAGNVSKTGNLNFVPGYTASTNHMLAPYTYDTNGNLLHDATTNVDYTWDAYGTPLSVTGSTLVNDAGGRLVEKVTGSTHSYIVNSPVGMIGTASSLTSASNLVIPLPGISALQLVAANQPVILHRDFMDSTRLKINFNSRAYNESYAYGPMGEVYRGTPGASQFEGTLRNTVSSATDDYGEVRYESQQGRTISPTGGANGYVKSNKPF
jgi:hypothetical protein